MLEYFPENVSSIGIEHDKLFAIIYYICVATFCLVNITLAYFLIKYRRKRGVKAYYFHGNNIVEFTWTLLPTLLFLSIGFYSDDLWTRMKYQDAVPVADVEVECLGQQYLWHYRYPGPDGVFGAVIPSIRTSENIFAIDPDDPAGKDDLVLSNVFYLPINKTLVVKLSSVDVLHSFFLPNFRIKQDAVPGLNVDVWFDCFKAGNYELACAELCGSGHYSMRGELRMLSEEDYNEWLQGKYDAILASLNPEEAAADDAPPGDEAETASEDELVADEAAEETESAQ